MFNWLYILTFVMLISPGSYAEVKIALFSTIDTQTCELQSPWFAYPDEQRYHAAIEVNNKWYQMQPMSGLTQAQSLSEILNEYNPVNDNNKKRMVEVFINKNLNLPDINLRDYKEIKFDMFAGWDDKSSSHCSKFIANIMDIEPIMSSGSNASLNISPDDLFDIFTARGWKKVVYQF